MMLPLDQPPSTWARVGEVTKVLVDVTILLGAIAAVIKFQLFDLLAPRWHSTVECSHHVLPDGSIVFVADYRLTNTGQRPLRVTSVSLRLLHPREQELVLLPDETRPPIAERSLTANDPRSRGNFRIEPGERTIFPLRCHLPDLPDSVFVACSFKLRSSREHTIYRGFYCRHPVERSTRASRPIGPGAD